MRLQAACNLSFECASETPVVMMLRARSRGAPQRIIDERLRFGRDIVIREYIDSFGNVCERFVAPRGELTVQTEVVAEVPTHVTVRGDAARTPVANLPDAALQYTLPSRYCPSDRLAELAREITCGREPGYGEVAAIRDFVHGRLDYRYGVSGPHTDALETLTQGAGVCRDFTHVAIALCRAIDIPARMTVGYLHGLTPMDLHAWFEAFIGGQWYTFDACEDTLLGGRIVVAYGRDAADVAFVTDYGSLRLVRMEVSVHESVAELAPARLRAVG
jgi:transglutaminase-like putative cysteine protease